MDLLTMVMTALGTLIGATAASYMARRGTARATGLMAQEWPSLKEAVDFVAGLAGRVDERVEKQGREIGARLDALDQRLAKLEAHVGLAARVGGLRVVPTAAPRGDGEDKEKTR